jgi:hypothetical protein
MSGNGLIVLLFDLAPIISGSVTSVTLDRFVRIAAALGLTMDLDIKKSA